MTVRERALRDLARAVHEAYAVLREAGEEPLRAKRVVSGVVLEELHSSRPEAMWKRDRAAMAAADAEDQQQGRA